jgi:hypothetical protein
MYKTFLFHPPAVDLLLLSFEPAAFGLEEDAAESPWSPLGFRFLLGEFDKMIKWNLINASQENARKSNNKSNGHVE